jgi:tetraacyldisaccharide 4'-kinase
MIVTTEKDETRLRQVEGLSQEVRDHLYVLPISIQILLDQEEAFNQCIINYVRKKSRKSIMVKGKDNHKSKDSNLTGDRPLTISFK